MSTQLQETCVADATSLNSWIVCLSEELCTASSSQSTPSLSVSSYHHFFSFHYWRKRFMRFKRHA
jgi:hypothetical protein